MPLKIIVFNNSNCKIILFGFYFNSFGNFKLKVTIKHIYVIPNVSRIINLWKHHLIYHHLIYHHLIYHHLIYHHLELQNYIMLHANGISVIIKCHFNDLIRYLNEQKINSKNVHLSFSKIQWESMNYKRFF